MTPEEKTRNKEIAKKVMELLDKLDKEWKESTIRQYKDTTHVKEGGCQKGVSYMYGGLQLLPEYKKKCDPKFLKWYLKEFTNNRMIYGHWSAGPRGVNFSDYHKMVLVRDNAVMSLSNESCAVDMYHHTFGRNSGSCAICLAGFHYATTSDLGDEQATPDQLRRFAKDVAEICCNLRIPVGNFMSHAEAADNVDLGPEPPYDTPGLSGSDAAPYGPLSGVWERWDLHVWVNKKTLKLEAPNGKKVLEPKGDLVPLTDWVRGEAILRVQDATYKYWGK